MRLLRWATIFILILVIVGVALSYPTLRDRYTTQQTIEAEASLQKLALTYTIVDPPTELTPSDTPTSVVPAVMIVPSTPQTMTEAVTTTQSTGTPAPPAIATTSLLAPAATTTREVLTDATHRAPNRLVDTSAVTSTVIVTVLTPVPAPPVTAVISPNIAAVVIVTATTPPPDIAEGQGPAEGEKGYEVPIETPGADRPALTAIASAMSSSPPTITPILVTPVVMMTVEVTATSLPAALTPIVILAGSATPIPLVTPMPLGPFANANTPLYGGPSLSDPVVGQAVAGEPLAIVGLYTEGTWYLLFSGLWIPGEVVSNAPPTMPLVFPTMTPIPSATPTVTPTPLPTETVVGSPTPTPEPTSLDQPICDCSGDNLDCLGNIFANRAQAQQCFEYCFRQTGTDIHLLDPNLNGMACENLP